MDVKTQGALSAVVARNRGRARLRAATLTAGAAGLVTAGVVAYHLPGAAHTATVTTHGTAGTSGSAAVHSTSGGSSVAASSSTAARSTGVASADDSAAHATSGGS